MSSIANILLEVTGDSDDAQRALADVAADLAVFGRETAEAEVDIDTAGAEAHLDELKAQLASFSAEDATADVNVRITEAQAEIAALQAELSKLDGEDVTIDVDVRRGIAERIGALVRDVEGLGRSLEKSAGEAGGFAEAFSTAGAGLAGFSDLIAPLIVMLGVSLVAAAAAAAASLAEAVGGVLALGDAFGAALIPGIALGIGAILRFKDTSDEAGSAANELKESFGEFGDVFQHATAGGADAVFRGLTGALRDLSPMVKELGPAFTKLGQAGGDAFRLLGKEFSSPAWQHFFASMIDSLAKLTPIFARSFGALARILANIAQASMPFLIAGLRDVAHWLDGIARSTSHIGDLRNGIGGLVGQLKAWLGLGKALGNVFLGFLEAAAPQGQSLTEWLTKGAEAFADWEKSKAGREAIRSFFHDVLPVAKEAIKAFFNVGKIVLQIAQFFAPLAAAGLHAFNLIAGAISDVIGWLTDLDRATKLENLKSAFSDFLGGVFDAVKKPIEFLFEIPMTPLHDARDLWNSVKGIISDTINFVLHAPRNVLDAIRGIWRSAKGVVSDAINFVLHAPRTVLGTIRGIWQSAKGIVSDVISFVLKVPRDALGAARDVWNGVKGVVSDAINFVLKMPGVGGLVSAARGIWDAINSALPDITIDIHIPTPSLPHIPGTAVGVRDRPESGLSLVGEQGPELAFLPKGVDVFTASETRKILRALADGTKAGLAGGRAAPSLAGVGGAQINNFEIKAPAGEQPDAETTLALIDLKLRTRGVFAS